MAETHIQGTVLRITFRNEENGYTVAKVKCKELSNPETAVIGCFPSIDIGEFGVFKGEWVTDKHYGRQFSAQSFEFITPSSPKGIERLLSKGKFRGIGNVYAKKIVNHFGVDTIEIIEKTPHRLMEVPGIGKERMETIKRSWDRKKELKNINLFLAEKGIPLHFAGKIFARYRENSIDILRHNPYQLTYDITGIGFKTADAIALETGHKHDSKERIQAAIIYMLKQGSNEGHVFLPKNELIERGARFLQISEESVEKHITILQSSNRIAVDLERVYIRYLYVFEQQIVQRLLNIQKSGSIEAINNIDGQISEIERYSNITYTSRQKEALRESLLNKVVLITGGPGTGKTTIIRGLIALFRKRKLKVRLAAPTGRAAKRMEETCSSPAQTIHRLLDFNPKDNTFSRNRSSPVDGDVIIIDESSMIDTPLMAALLNGIDSKSRILFVGDADQLPSVGPGNVFRDIIESGRIPIFRLDTIFRQSESSNIVVAAHEINHGVVPKIYNKSSDNLFFLVEKEPESVTNKLIELVKKRLPSKYGFDPFKDVQVITPMYKSVTGANNFNTLLQQKLNPDSAGIKQRDREFRIGDKVMQVQNNYGKDVYNGDIGFISAIRKDDEEMIVQYEGRRVSYAFNELDQLVLAYAITVHKSQGSEYRAVVMPLTTQHFIMLQKNLLYTAVTRARELMILIGTYKALNIAVKNNKTAERFTFLAERLRNPEKFATQLDFLEPAGSEGCAWR